jgi:nuclear GTP-binding protein
LSPVEEILALTQTERSTKIYDLPTFSSTLEFLTMLALSTDASTRSVSPFLSSKTQKKPFHSCSGGTFDILSAARHVLIDWDHQKIPFLSEPPTLHAAHIPSSTIPGSGRDVAPGAETTGQAHIVNALGMPFVLGGLFGEVDAEAIDAEPDSELPN